MFQCSSHVIDCDAVSRHFDADSLHKISPEALSHTFPSETHASEQFRLHVKTAAVVE